MCLGIPMRVLSCKGLTARCEAKGHHRDVSLLLLLEEDVGPGDFVVVSAGHALQKISEAEALSTWALYDEMLTPRPR
jgi:hydrogenase expression/formation protein HypC